MEVNKNNKKEPNSVLSSNTETYGFKIKEQSCESPSESRFNLAEKFFIPKSDNNWYSKEYVDELQKFYQSEREILKSKINSIYQKTDAAKLDMMDENEKLKV